MKNSYLLFLVSVVILGTGISLVTVAELGTTAITSPPYVLSFVFPLSFGLFTMLMNTLYVVMQMVLLGKEFPKVQYLQLLVGPVLGAAIDFWTVLFSYIPQPHYIIQLALVLVGCFVIAWSIVLQLKANVVNSPAEGIVKVIAMKTGKSFALIKVLFDVALVVSAAVLSFAAFGTVYGIREGTIISALLTGYFIKWIQTLAKYEWTWRKVIKERS